MSEWELYQQFANAIQREARREEAMSDPKYTTKSLPLTWTGTGTGVGYPIQFPRCAHCGTSAPHHYMRTVGKAYCFDCVAKAIELLEKTP